MKAFEILNIILSIVFFMVGLALIVIGVIDIPLDGANPPPYLAVSGLGMVLIACVRLMLTQAPNRRF